MITTYHTCEISLPQEEVSESQSPLFFVFKLMLIIESHYSRLRAGETNLSYQFGHEKTMRVYVDVLDIPHHIAN